MVIASPLLAEVKITDNTPTQRTFGTGLLEAFISISAGNLGSRAEIKVDNDDGTFDDAFDEGGDVEIRIDKSAPATGTLIFSGILERIEEIEPVKGASTIRFGAIDHSWILLERLINTAYHVADETLEDGTSIDTIVKDLVTKDEVLLAFQMGIDEPLGITTTNVQSYDQKIKHIVFPKMPVSDCLKQLADLSLSSFYLDTSKDLHFFQDESIVSTIALLDADIIQISKLKDGTNLKTGITVDGADLLVNDISQTLATGNVSLHTNFLADEFTPGEASINGIAARMEKVGSPVSDLKGEIKVDGPSGTTPQGGAVLSLFSIAKERVPLGPLPASPEGFSFFDAIGDLETDRKYWIIFFKTGDVNNTYKWHHDSGTTKTNATSADGITWSVSSTSHDFAWFTKVLQSLTVAHYDTAAIAKFKLREMAINDPSIVEEETAEHLVTGLARLLAKSKRTLTIKAFPTDTPLVPGELIPVTHAGRNLSAAQFELVEATYNLVGMSALSIDYELVRYV